MQSLLDCKKEYTDIILDNLTVPICTFIYDMYKGCLNIQEFQNKMAQVKNWNNNLIQEYCDKILKKCKKYDSSILSKLLNEIIVIITNSHFPCCSPFLFKKFPPGSASRSRRESLCGSGSGITAL